MNVKTPRSLDESKRAIGEVAAQRVVIASGSAATRNAASVTKLDSKRPGRKAPAKAAGSKPAATGPAKGTSTKAKPVRGAKAATKTSVTQKTMDEHGFVVGSDSSIIADILVKGGLSRKAINDSLHTKINATQNRNGNPKNVPSLVSGIISRLQKRGYMVEESFKMIPPVINRQALINQGKAEELEERTVSRTKAKASSAKRKPRKVSRAA